MDFFEAVQQRRSIRRFTNTKVPENIINKALDAALLAPNSSNAQTWNFYWVQTESLKTKLVEICLNQSAARTASDLIIVTANPKNWQRSWKPLADFVVQIKAPKAVVFYYQKLFPFMYRWGFLNCIGLPKKLAFSLIGLFKPIVRGPALKSEIQQVCIKSAALAAENFVLAIKAQGFDSCMMEGFDEVRLKKVFKLSCFESVAMVIAVGESTENGTWGPQFRLPKDLVVHRV